MHGLDKHAVFSFQVDQDLPKVISDEGRLRQIMFNLLGNALKFTSSGDVGLYVGCPTSDRTRLIIRVKDSGIGIPMGKQKDIFKPFVQVGFGSCLDAVLFWSSVVQTGNVTHS